MNALLPPSSRIDLFVFRAATSPIWRPIAVEPVNAMTRGAGCSGKWSPITGISVTMTLINPAGSPASSKMEASRVPPIRESYEAQLDGGIRFRSACLRATPNGYRE